MSKKYRIFLVVVILVAAAAAFYFFIFNNDNKLSTQEIEVTDDVISQASSADSSNETNSTEQEDQEDPVKPGTPSSQQLPEGKPQATLSRVSQEGDTIIARGFGVSSSGGSCRLILQKEDKQLEYSSDSSLEVSQYQCSGFEVPASELSGGGTWSAKIIFTDNDNNSAESNTISFEVST